MRRYDPGYEPNKIATDIQKLISQQKSLAQT